jgi:hypothetical protein
LDVLTGTGSVVVSDEVAIITLTVMTGGASWGDEFSMIIGAVEGVDVEVTNT